MIDNLPETLVNKVLDGRFNTLTDIPSSAVAGLDADITALQALPACFSVHKNSVDQTGISDSTHTLVTFSTELYDIGGFFNTGTGAWTPPAGKVSIKACCYIFGTVTVGNAVITGIYKNGNLFKYATGAANLTLAGASPTVAIEDIANGTDAYTAYAYLDVNSGTATVSGLPELTYFMGHWISA
jgi:hypothetical protein